MSGSDDTAAEPEWVRRQRLATIFGELLPDITTDDQAESAPPGTETDDDEWLRLQVPPHHG
jgi:hypothetical protein